LGSDSSFGFFASLLYAATKSSPQYPTGPKHCEGVGQVLACGRDGVQRDVGVVRRCSFGAAVGV